jgi:MAE_28990/MAE_18760-like HEPN
VKIRSKLELTDALARDLSKRKRALSNLLSAYVRSRPHEVGPCACAAVCLLYGHWEGFVKFAATSYVRYVAFQRIRAQDLATGLLSLTVRERLRSAIKAKRMGIHREVVEEVRDNADKVARLRWHDSIETFDNLNTEVLSEILATFGLHAEHYMTRKLIIDERLLGCRNRIAHSGYTPDEDIDYEELHGEVIGLMDRFRDDVENAVTLELYYRFRRKGGRDGA